MYFLNISPNLCYEGKLGVYNFNLLMWDIETNNLDPEKMLK